MSEHDRPLSAEEIYQHIRQLDHLGLARLGELLFGSQEAADGQSGCEQDSEQTWFVQTLLKSAEFNEELLESYIELSKSHEEFLTDAIQFNQRTQKAMIEVFLHLMEAFIRVYEHYRAPQKAGAAKRSKRDIAEAIIELRDGAGHTFGEIGGILSKRNPNWVGKDGRPMKYQAVKTLYYHWKERLTRKPDAWATRFLENVRQLIRRYGELDTDPE